MSTKNAKVGWFFFLEDIEEGLDSRRIVREVVRMGILVALTAFNIGNCWGFP